MGVWFLEHGARYVRGYTVLVIPNDKHASWKIAEGLYKSNAAKKFPGP